MTIKIPKICLIITAMLFCSAVAYANNLSVTNVSLATRDPGTKTLVISMDLAWENSWRNKINHDAVWLTVRLNNTQVSPTNKKLCEVTASGVNPTGSSIGTGSNIEFYVPSDKKGAFLRRSVNGNVGNVSTQNAQLTIKYDSCGFSDADQIYVSVLGLEMVFIPQGSFYVGDYNASTASLNKGSADNNPWFITSENAIAVTNATNNGFQYVSNNNAGEYATGATFTLPANYPKGYQGFYIMKYELTEGQWIEFVNSLPTESARSKRDLTDNTHKNSDSVVARNTISCVGTPIICTSQRPTRAVSYLNWMDIAAFLDWNALRPMSELEFEKTCRGSLLPIAGEYPWGNTEILSAMEISAGSEDGSETITTLNANANYGNNTLSGGDTANGLEYLTGALRGGIFAKLGSTRITAGASYYGVMDLGGNLSEPVVTIGNAAGSAYTAMHGNGNLTSVVGYEGNADVQLWPGIDAIAERGVTTASGSGVRGGSWNDNENQLQVSNRSQAAVSLSTANNTYGLRGVRTYDGN